MSQQEQEVKHYSFLKQLTTQECLLCNFFNRVSSWFLLNFKLREDNIIVTAQERCGKGKVGIQVSHSEWSTMEKLAQLSMADSICNGVLLLRQVSTFAYIQGKYAPERLNVHPIDNESLEHRFILLNVTSR